MRAQVIPYTVRAMSWLQRCIAALSALGALGLAGCGDPQLRMAHAALGDGRYEAAIAAYEQARRRLPQGKVPLDRLASAHRAFASQRVRAGDCRTARSHFLAAERLSEPVLADHRALYECTAAQQAEPATLYEDLTHLASLGDTRVVVRRKLAHTALELHRDGEAEAHFAVLETRQVLTWSERKVLMRLLLRLGQEDRALPYLEHVVAADPSQALDRFKLAELYESRGRQTEARRVYERLTRDFADNPVVHLRFADFLTNSGDVDGARRARVTANRLRGLVGSERDLRPLLKSRR